MLRPIQKTKVYEAIVEQIREHIEGGIWPEGTQLPSERELAEQLNIGRPSVREALRVLEVMGLVEIRQGQGTFVAARSNQSRPMRLLESMLQEDSHVVELLEVREFFEPQIAYLAAQSATEDDIRSMEDILQRMETVIATGETGVDENIEFHLALTEAVGNRVLLQVHQLLLHLSRDPVERFFQVPGRLFKSLEGHYEVLRAIKERNPEQAQQRMLEHLRTRFAVPNSDHHSPSLSDH
jgi:GntR family transcriptional repressor for pyruvate dehydrogenase complex